MLIVVTFPFWRFQMKRTALAVLGIALLLISFTACNPSSNNGPIVLPGGGNTPPSQGQTAQDIADALVIPTFVKDILKETPATGVDIKYTLVPKTTTISITSANGTDDPESSLIDGEYTLTATVGFTPSYSSTEVEISEGKITYKVDGTVSSNTFTANNATGTVETTDLVVNGKTVKFNADVNITITVTPSGDDYIASGITVSNVHDITATVDNTPVNVEDDTPAIVDPDEPTIDDDEEESGDLDVDGPSGGDQESAPVD